MYGPAVRSEAAGLIGHCRALADQASADAMESQQVHLLRRLDAHEAHRRPLHGFGDRFGVAIVVLVALEERLHVLRRDQSHVMTEGFELPWPGPPAATAIGGHSNRHRARNT